MASPAKNKDPVSVSASSSLLSPSSPSIPCRPSAKPRNSETGDPMRRSFRGNPFPADLSRRHSIGRVEFGGDKENQNDKDHHFSNVVKAPKGAKNFMSPTISAVSKINPSPRKKVLSDKNELSRSFDKTSHHHHHHQVKSCVSFSDVISFIGEDKDREQNCIIDEKKQLVEEKEESHDITVTDFHENMKNNGDFDDSSFKISPLPPSVPYTFPVFGSQEVDPLVAPYDPKKNYLSPRPQFLHYKPNPRIEHHFDECKQLEELFVSESSSSDTDLSAEESQQEEEVVVAAVEEEAGEIKEEERLEAAEIDDDEEEVVGESIEEEEVTHQISKQSRFKISKLLGWVLALAVAYLLLVSSATLPQPNIIKDSPLCHFHIPPEITKSAKESFEQLSETLRMWAGSSLVYLDKLISSLGEEEGYGAFQFHNLTDILEDTRLSDAVFKPTSGEEISSVAGLLVDSQDWSVAMDIEEESGGHQESESSGEINLEAVYEEDGSEFKQESEGGEVNSEMNGYSISLPEEENGGQEIDEGQRESQENDQKIIEEAESEAHQLDDEDSGAVNGGHIVEEAESEAHHDVESGAVNGGHQQEETEVSNAETLPEEEVVGEIAGSSLDMSAETSDVVVEGEGEIGEVVDAACLEEITDVDGESGIGKAVDVAGLEETLLSSSTTVMVVLLVAAAAFLLTKMTAKKPVMMVHEDVVDVPTTTFEHVPVENLIKEKLSSLHFQEDEEEVVDEGKREVSSSFPSQMSFSFQKNKPLQTCSNKKEGQSGGGGGKKSNDSGESMASSASEYSVGSLSYGSFTTYEKIQKKSGRKEAEIVTPVRRSSRIRSQHSGQ